MTRLLDDVVEGLCAALVVALAVVVFLQVFNRFVLQAPLAWSEDIAMLLFQWVAFLGAAVGVRRWRHFGIELVVRRLPPRGHALVETLVPVLIAVVAVTMIVQGFALIEVNRSRTYPTMDLSYLWAFLPIPVSGALMIVYLVAREVERWRGAGAPRGNR